MMCYCTVSPLQNQVERWIDELDSRLPKLTNFILPSGGPCSAHLHVARTVCRRAERAVTPLVASGQVDPEVGVYLNRCVGAWLLERVGRMRAWGFA
jgi:ATP:cob(I)alamin adenosyltransferase